MKITKNWKIAITVGAIIMAAIAGLSFVNYRKKRIRNVSKLYLGVEETGNNQGFNNAVFEKMMRLIRDRKVYNQPKEAKTRKAKCIII